MENVKTIRYEIGAFYKRHPDDKVWWVDAIGQKGPLLFSFDRETIFNYWPDYPHNLTAEQKAIFDKENPFWAEFRCEDPKPADLDDEE